jgi:hypothetical protein
VEAMAASPLLVSEFTCPAMPHFCCPKAMMEDKTGDFMPNKHVLRTAGLQSLRGVHLSNAPFPGVSESSEAVAPAVEGENVTPITKLDARALNSLLYKSKDFPASEEASIWSAVRESYNTKTLELPCRGLSDFPEQIYSEEALQFELRALSLRGNKIETIPGLFIAGVGKYLTSLNMSNNSIGSLPLTINQFIQLKDLYLDHNKITCLPTELLKLTKLQTLSLNDNRMNSLPEEICFLESLTDLRLDRNPMKMLPGSLSLLIKLQRLDFFSNQLITLALVPGLTKKKLRTKKAVHVEDTAFDVVHDPATNSTFWVSRKTGQAQRTAPEGCSAPSSTFVLAKQVNDELGRLTKAGVRPQQNGIAA